MPTFEIGLKDGRTLEVDANDEAAALKGVEHFVAQEAKTKAAENPSLASSLRAGAGDVLTGVGKTLKDYNVAPSAGDTLARWGANVTPEGYQSQTERFFNPKAGDTTINPGAALESATGPRMPKVGPFPRLMGDEPWLPKADYSVNAIPGAVAEGLPGLAADVTAGKLLKVPGVIGSYFTRSAGERAEQHAKNAGNEKPSAADLFMGGATALGEGAVQAPFARAVSTPTRIGSTGIPGAIAGAVTAPVKGGAIGGVTGAAQSAIEQAGTTAGTPGGIQIDPKQVVGSGILGGVTGAAVSTPRAALRDVPDAFRMRQFDGPLRAGSEDLANRIAGRTEAANPERALGNTKTARDAVARAELDVFNELSDARKGVELSKDADNAINAAQKGERLSPRDLAAVDEAKNPALSQLVRTATANHLLLKQGQMTGTRFSGGLAAKAADLARRHPIFAMHTLLGTGGLGALLGGSLATGGLTAAGTLGILGLMHVVSRQRGTYSPAQTFVSKFANGTLPIRPAAPAPVTLPQRPTGPAVPPLPTPWGATPPEAVPPRIPQRATGPVVKPVPTPWGAEPPLPAEAPRAAPTEAEQLADSIKSGKTLMAALERVKALKEKTTGAADAAEEVKQSPFIEQTVGSPEAVPAPQAAKSMSQMISAARALQKLRSDPAAEAADKAQARADKEAERAQARADKEAERAQVRAKREADREAARQLRIDMAKKKEPALPPTPPTALPQVGAGDNVFPIKPVAAAPKVFEPMPSDTAHMSPSELANKLTSDRKAANLPFYVGEKAFRESVIKRQTVIHDVAAKLASEFPGVLDRVTVVSWMQGEKNRAAAKQLRDHIKSLLPSEDASRVDQIMSDAKITDIYKKVGKPRE